MVVPLVFNWYLWFLSNGNIFVRFHKFSYVFVRFCAYPKWKSPHCGDCGLAYHVCDGHMSESVMARRCDIMGEIHDMSIVMHVPCPMTYVECAELSR